MTYEARETSEFNGRKVFLYTWVRGSAYYRFVAADDDVVLDFQRYTGSGSIEHGDIEQGTEAIRAGLEVTVEMTHPVADLYRTTPPHESVLLLIQSYHVGDEQFRIPEWQGRVTGVKWRPEKGVAEIAHEPTYTSLKRTGLRRNYQRLCPLVWGGKRCGVNAEAFAQTAEVQEVEGLVLTVPALAAHPDGYYDGGFMVYEITSGVTERRNIVPGGHVGSSITVAAFPTGLVAGMVPKFYPGDDHTADTCADKFGNNDNYGGMIYFPRKNPFGGNPIY